MNTRLKRLACIGAALCLSANLYAGSAADAVQAEGAYARAVPPGLPNSAAFVDLSNTGTADHALVAAESTAAQVVELHTHSMEDGMMRMRQVEKIPLPAGETVQLRPGGLHIMLIGLDHQLQPGETVELTLIYEDGSRETLITPVSKVQAMQPKDHAHHHHH